MLLYVVDRRPNSKQARIRVLGFSANRVWLVSRFIFYFGDNIGAGPDFTHNHCAGL